MKEVRVGIIGVGHMGFSHLHCIANGNIKGMRVTAICDINPAQLAVAEKEYPAIARFSEPGELMTSNLVDAVIIATPHPSHADIAKMAFAVGLHVLTEKPEDIRASKAAELNRIAVESGKVFGIMFNQRTNPVYSRARELVRGGKLGALKRVVWIITNWYRTQHYYESGGWRATWAGEGGGVLLNQAPHNLDLLQWICGMPVSLTAHCQVGKYHKIEVEDDVSIHCTFANGATGTFLTSTGEYPGTNRLEIAGDLGKIVIEDGILRHWSLEIPEHEFCEKSGESFASIPYVYTEHRPTEPEAGHRGILQNFTDAILTGVPLLAPGTDGIFELMISNAAYLSEWTGNREIALPPDFDDFDQRLSERIEKSGYHSDGELSHGGEYEARWQTRW